MWWQRLTDCGLSCLLNFQVKNHATKLPRKISHISQLFLVFWWIFNLYLEIFHLLVIRIICRQLMSAKRAAVGLKCNHNNSNSFKVHSRFHYHGDCNPRGGNLDFEWQGWLKNFLGFEIFDFKIFWGRKILATIFWVFYVISCKVFWKFLCLGNLAWDFWGVLWKP